MSLQGQMLRIHSKRFWVGEQRDATVYGVVVRVFVHRGSGESSGVAATSEESKEDPENFERWHQCRVPDIIDLNQCGLAVVTIKMTGCESQ